MRVWGMHILHWLAKATNAILKYVILIAPEGKRPLGRPRCRWEDDIKMDLQVVGGDCVDWLELA
jgi:hypothetical protein